MTLAAQTQDWFEVTAESGVGIDRPGVITRSDDDYFSRGFAA
jgi:hypothetical protein